MLTRKPLNGLVLCVFLALVSGCTGHGRHYAGMAERLEIDVRANGSKLFVYRLSAESRHLDPERIRIYRGASRARREQRRHQLSSDRAYRHLQANTKRALARTGYCRDGYLELDRRMAPHTLWVRGECRESASERDRERFAGRNVLTIPVPE